MSSSGPFSVNTRRNRGPLMARSQPWPDCEWKIDRRQSSNDGRQRRMTRSTASVRAERAAGSNCGQITRTGIESAPTEPGASGGERRPPALRTAEVVTLLRWPIDFKLSLMTALSSPGVDRESADHVIRHWMRIDKHRASEREGRGCNGGNDGR